MASRPRRKAVPASPRKAEPMPPSVAPARGPAPSRGTYANVAWFVAATLGPFLLAFFVAAALFEATSGLDRKAQELQADGIAVLALAGGLAMAILGWLRRQVRRGQLLLVAAASTWASVGFTHPGPPAWMVVPGLFVLFAGLPIALPPATRMGHAVLAPLAAVGLLQTLPIGTDSTAITGIVGAHWILSWLLLAPQSAARAWVATALLVLAASAAVLGWYFLAVDATGRRFVFAAIATGVATVFAGLLWHPRLRLLAVRPPAAWG